MTMTLKELGQLARVHPSTVARVLNDDPRQRVSEDVRQRILALAHEHGYQPNHLARSLRTKRSFVIGTAIPDIANPFFAMMFRGIEDGLAQRDYSVILANTDDDPTREQRSIAMLRGRQVDGLILATARLQDPAIEALEAAGFPFVLVNRRTDLLQPYAVVPDDRAGAAEAVEYLIGLGHRRIAHIAGPDNISTGHGRRTGYRDALTRHGLPDDPELVVEGSFREQGGYEAMVRLLALAEPPTAVFAVNDLAAAGALRAAKEAGLHVPRDLSLVGFNDLPTAVHTIPRLTTMRQPLQDMGVMAARRLLARLAGDETSQTPIVVPLTLIVRESTGPVPEARNHVSMPRRAT